MDGTEILQQWHRGRSWAGHLLEDECPCVQEPCGLIGTPDPNCPEHSVLATKTIRQSHLAADCPGKEN